MSRLYRNQQDQESKQKHKVTSQATRIFEGTITDETIKILSQLRSQVGNSRTAMQIKLDTLVRMVSPKMAYNNLGTDQFPMPLTAKALHNSWWECILLEALKLVYGYYEAIREGESAVFTKAGDRWTVLLANGLDNYYATYIPTRHAVGYVLMTRGEQAEMKLRADEARVEREKRVGEK